MEQNESLLRLTWGNSGDFYRSIIHGVKTEARAYRIDHFISKEVNN